MEISSPKSCFFLTWRALVGLLACEALAACGGSPDDFAGADATSPVCTADESECVSDLSVRICTEAGMWETQECPTTYTVLPEGCTWDSVVHGCQNGACWIDCDDDGTACFSDGPCADEETIWACLDQHEGLELVDCDEHVEGYPDQTCACGAWCEEWVPGYGQCRCDCPGGCTDPPSEDPGCGCCEPDGGTADPDAGADGGAIIPDAGG